jgi:hypothetical protein
MYTHTNSTAATVNTTAGKRPFNDGVNQGSNKKPKNSPAVLRQSWASLDEENVEIDRRWIQDKAEYTDERNKKSTVCYPKWTIVGRKYAGIEYEFSTGNISVVFRQYGEKPAGVTMDIFEWTEFCEKFSLIQKLIHVVEGKKTDITPEDLFTGENIHEFRGWKTVCFSLDISLRLAVKWNTATKGVLAIISRGFEETLPGKKYTRFHAKPEDSILIGATGLDYLIRYLENRIINGIHLWTNVRKVGDAAWHGCFLLPENNKGATNQTLFAEPTEEEAEILAQALEDSIIE